MADDNHRLAKREPFLGGVKFSPQDRSGIGIGIATRVAVKPELVIAPDVCIAAQAVEHRRPRRGRIHQPMDDKHDSLVRVVGLKP